MSKILISACLVGQKVRWDGGDCEQDVGILVKWQKEGVLLPFCPECAGGLPVPREPAEIQGGMGREVLAGRAAVVTRKGINVTDAFLAGARVCLDLAEREKVIMAILKEGSPSCGSGRIYDGSFSGGRIPGKGVTAALLEEHGFPVFSEQQLDEAAEYYRRHISSSSPG